jgi:hypothetical protein
MTMIFGAPWLVLLSLAYFGWYAKRARLIGSEPHEPHAN